MQLLRNNVVLLFYGGCEHDTFFKHDRYVERELSFATSAATYMRRYTHLIEAYA